MNDLWKEILTMLRELRTMGQLKQFLDGNHELHCEDCVFAVTDPEIAPLGQVAAKSFVAKTFYENEHRKTVTVICALDRSPILFSSRCDALIDWLQVDNEEWLGDFPSSAHEKAELLVTKLATFRK